MEGYILGISCGYHDSAAALIKDGKVLGGSRRRKIHWYKTRFIFSYQYNQLVV